MGILVRAVRTGYFGAQLRYPGVEFTIETKEQFSNAHQIKRKDRRVGVRKGWMEPVRPEDAKALGIEFKTGADLEVRATAPGANIVPAGTAALPSGTPVPGAPSRHRHPPSKARKAQADRALSEKALKEQKAAEAKTGKNGKKSTGDKGVL